MELFAVSRFVASIQKTDPYFSMISPSSSSSFSGVCPFEMPSEDDDDDNDSDSGDKTSIRCAYSAAISVFPIPLTPWRTTMLDLNKKKNQR